MPIQIKKLIYLNSNGLLNRIEDGAITNIGGTDRSSFTVDGIPVLLDYGNTQGPGNAGNVEGHVHFQYAASAVWTIQHNKNSWHPLTTAWNAQLQEIIPMQIVTVDENLVRVYFSAPMAGKLILGFTDETSVTIDGTEQNPPAPPQPPNPVFVNTVNGLWGDVVIPDATPVNLTAGAEIAITGTYPNLTIASTATHTAPVNLTAGAEIAITGTYPNLTIASTATHTAPVNLTAGTNVTITGTYPNLTIEAAGGGGAANFGQTFVRTVDFTGTTITVTHNLGSRFNIVQVYDDTGKMVIPDEVTSVNTNTTTIEVGSPFFDYSANFTVVIAPGAF